MSSELEDIDTLGEQALEKSSGQAFVIKWLFEKHLNSEAARHVIWQFAIFYAILALGFAFLYFMIRSTAQLREIRRNVADAIKAQQARKFDLDNYSGMAYGGIA